MLKLIGINLLLLSLVLGAAFVSMHFFIKSGLEGQAVHMMNVTAREGRFRGLPASPRNKLFLSSIFFIKTDFTGAAIRISPNAPLSKKSCGQLLRKTESLKSDRGLVRFRSYRFRFIKAAKPYGFIFVFFDTRPEQGVLSWFATAALFIGGSSLILAALVSYFLAGRALVPIKEAWKQQQDFIADASHELRTPLAVIQTNLDLVRGNPGETIESQGRWLENIAFECGMMVKIIDGLLFLARADSDRTPVPMEDFPLSEALRSVVASFEPVAAAKGIELTSILPPDLVVIRGQEDRIKQLAAILLDNAVKHTSDKGRIALSLSKVGGHSVRMTVTDTGEGIPQEHLSRIFQRFYRVDTARHHRNGGSGLGLSIAKQVVIEHHGTIQASSVAGKGSVFQVLLPIHRG